MVQSLTNSVPFACPSFHGNTPLFRLQGSGTGAGGIPAKDALGNDIMAKAYLDSKPVNDRSLAQGLKGDATYVSIQHKFTVVHLFVHKYSSR
jgi:hypothetical protein